MDYIDVVALLVFAVGFLSVLRLGEHNEIQFFDRSYLRRLRAARYIYNKTWASSESGRWNTANTDGSRVRYRSRRAVSRG